MFRLLVILVGFFLLLGPASACAPPGSKSAGQSDDTRKKAAGDKTRLSKAMLREINQKIDESSAAEYGKALPMILEKIGPGAVDANIRRDEGVTFTSVPVDTLLDEGATLAVAAQGLESLARPNDVSKVFPVKQDSRVLTSFVCSWDVKENAILRERWDPDESAIFAKQIDNARQIHSEATHTPLNKYKGVSFYGLNKHFLYLDTDDHQEMIPLEVDPQFGFRPGHAEPAEKVLAALKKLASDRSRVDESDDIPTEDPARQE